MNNLFWNNGDLWIRFNIHKTGDRTYYLTVFKEMDVLPTGGFTLILRKKKSGRNNLVFRYPTFTKALNSVIAFVYKEEK